MYFIIYFNGFSYRSIFAQMGQKWVFADFNVFILFCNCATVDLNYIGIATFTVK